MAKSRFCLVIFAIEHKAIMALAAGDALRTDI